MTIDKNLTGKILEPTKNSRFEIVEATDLDTAETAAIYAAAQGSARVTHEKRDQRGNVLFTATVKRAK